MEADKGIEVTISFTCRLDDGTPFSMGDQRTLRFVIGKGNTLPTLEQGVVGMQPGDRRTIEVPAAEVTAFLLKQGNHPGTERRPGFGYEFGPGDGGDVLFTIPQPTRPAHELPPAGKKVHFQVTMDELRG